MSDQDARIQRKRKRLRGAKLLLHAGTAGISLACCRPAVSAPPETGQWKVKWDKQGVSYTAGASYDFSKTPPLLIQSVNRQPLNGYDGIPFPIESRDENSGLGDTITTGTDEGYSTRLAGSYSETLLWYPGTSGDLPPTKIYILEFLFAINDADNSWLGGPILNYHATVDNGIGSEVKTYSNGPYNSGRRAQGWVLRAINNTQRSSKVPLPTLHLSNEGRFTREPSYFDRGQSSASLTRKTFVAQMSLSVRRRGSNDPFEPEATAAAGAIHADEHEVEVKLTVGLSSEMASSYYPPMSGLKVPYIPRIIRGNGIDRDAVFVPAENPITNDQGEAIIGYLRSSDKIKNTPPPMGKKDKRVEIKLPLGRGENDPSARTNQTVNGEWGMGQRGDLPWSAHFALGQVTPVVYKEHLIPSPRVPIDWHDVYFYVTRLKVKEWKDQTKTELVDRVYLLDDPEMNIPDEPGAVRKNIDFFATYVNLMSYNVHASELPNPGPTQSATVQASTAMDNLHQAVDDGYYMAAMLIPESDDWLVDEVQLGIKDTNVYVKKVLP